MASPRNKLKREAELENPYHLSRKVRTRLYKNNPDRSAELRQDLEGLNKKKKVFAQGSAQIRKAAKTLIDGLTDEQLNALSTKTNNSDSDDFPPSADVATTVGAPLPKLPPTPAEAIPELEPVLV